MQNIIQLLNQKNFHLEKFFELNEKEIINFSEGNFDNLENFYNTRESILDLIRCIDKLIDESNQPESAIGISDVDKHRILKALDKKNDLVTSILSQDLQILSFIEAAKSDIIRELSQVKMARKAVGAYKSGEVDKQLDEKV